MPAVHFVMPFRPAFDSSGVPIAGAQAVFTLTGTTTLTPIYTNEALTVQASNPLVANGVGRFAQVYLDDTVTYRVRIFDADADVDTDDPIEDYDPYDPVEQGAQGPQGESAVSVTVGTVTTLAAGADATVTNSGTATEPVLDFGIPRGATGLSGALSDGDYGDLTVSGGGATFTIDNQAVTLAKMANIATDTVIGRQTAGTGVPEALSIGASAGTDILDRAAGDGRYVQSTETLVVSLPVMAAAMTARTTNGAASGTTETTTNKIMLPTLDFDQSTVEYAQFMIAMPKSWNEGTVTAQFLWTATTTGDVVWGIQGVALSDSAVLDTAFGTAVTVTDSVTTANDLMQSSFTGACTIGSTPAAEDLVCFQVYRNASSGSDTLAADAKLIGIRLNFTTNARTDA